MDVRERKRRSRLIAKWRRSGATARAFAAGHGCTASQLHAWSSAERRADTKPAEFAEVRVRGVADEAERPPIEIVVGEVIVRVRAGADLEHLAAVLGVVTRC